jgi:hypothetical protein
MTTELLIQNAQGRVFEVSGITDGAVEYTTNRTGSAGKLAFTLIDASGLQFEEGAAVRFSVDGTKVFFGYVFSRSVDRWGVMQVTAYDQIRYLKANESFAFIGKTAGQIIQTIAGKFSLSVGQIDDTGYAIPSFIQENKSCLDIINHAVQLTVHNTGKIYVFFDDAGKLSLRLAESLKSPVVTGSESYLTEYDFKTDIDRETYNQIKLVRPNKDTGRADTYIVNDSSTISRWGLLQRYETVDEQLNPAQITQQAKTMLAYYNRALRTLTVRSLGVPGVRAGSMVMLNLPDIGEVSTNKFVLLERVTHYFSQNDHTMEFETRSL